MEKLCKNCEYFVQESVVIMDYGWGHCKKPTRSAVIDSEKERGVFTWADDFCNDFKLKQEAE